MNPTSNPPDYSADALLRRVAAENAEPPELLEAGVERVEVTDSRSPHGFGPEGYALVLRKPAADGR